MRDENIEKEIISFIVDDSLESSKERMKTIHLYDLLGCMRNAILNKKNPNVDPQTALWFLRGKGVHDYIEKLVAKYKKVETEKTIEYDINGGKLYFTPDIITENEIIDIKTAAKPHTDAKREETFYPHHRTQVLWYCSLTGKKIGKIIYFTFLKYSKDLRRYVSRESISAYRFDFSEQELEEAREEIKRRFLIFKKYMDEDILPPIEIPEDRLWSCNFKCTHRSTCMPEDKAKS